MKDTALPKGPVHRVLFARPLLMSDRERYEIAASFDAVGMREDRMKRLSEFTRDVAIFLFGIVLVTGAAVFAGSVSVRADARASRSDPQGTCTFSDGSTISFDHEIWRTGDYEAIPFRTSERMAIPPMERPIEIPAGTYTLFVIDKNGPPWTLIVSKKASKLGMPYPGEQYDLGRTQMGSDVQPAVKDFAAGCRLIKDGPAFLWMQSGRTVAYVKIVVEKGSGENVEYLVH